MSDYKGQCLCGDVQFTAKGGFKDIDTCHCSTCRALNAGPYMGADFREGITVTKGDSLKWYDSSEWARRAFCQNCGAALFYNLKGSEFMSVSVGCLDLPEGETLSKEYFIDEKPDFYDFAGERPRLTGEEVFASFQGGNKDA